MCVRYIYIVVLLAVVSISQADVIDDVLPELKAYKPKDSALYDITESTKAQFKPITDRDVATAKQEMIDSSKKLETFLKSNAKQWFDVLKWNQDGDTKQLYQTLRHINWGYNGLESPEFRDFAYKIKRYIDFTVASRIKEQPNVYKLQVELLANDLSRYNPTNDELEPDLCRRLRIVESFDQAPDLVSLVLSRHVKPNAFIQVSSGLASRFVKSDTKSEKIDDVILGTKLSIDAKTTTNITVRPVPSSDSAAFEVVVNGTTNSNSVGFNGPAVIRSSAVTRFIASQSVFLTDEAAKVSKPVAKASTRSTINSVTKNGGGLGSRIVANKGTQEARSKQGQSNAEAARHAEQRAEKKLSSEISQKVSELQKKYNEEIHDSFGRYGLYPEIRYQTNNDYVTSTITQSDYGQLGASTEPTRLKKNHDIIISLHRSAINNVMESFMGSAVIQESKVGKRPTIDAPIPEKLGDLVIPRYDMIAENPNYKPWTLELSSYRPITVNFDNDTIKITVHTESIVSGKDEFNGWDITQTMKPAIQPDGSVLASQIGALEIFPTDFNQKTDKLSSDQVSLRSALTKVINERTKAGVGFTTKIEIPTLSPEKLGKLVVTEISMAGGWATIGWDIENVAKK